MHHASTPNQGYSGRRSSGGYGGPRGSNGEMGHIWEVVSALANALQDARNQLVNLMLTSKSDQMRLSPMRVPPMRLSGGGSDFYSRSATPSRLYSPYAGARNVHRAHAHRHVAFGLSSEYPVHATPRRVRPRESYALSSTPATAGRRCTHPLHGIGPDAINPTPQSVQPSWPSGQVKGCRKSHCDELTRRERAVVNSSPRRTMGSSSGSRIPPQSRGSIIVWRSSLLLFCHTKRISSETVAWQRLLSGTRGHLGAVLRLRTGHLCVVEFPFHVLYISPF